MTEFEALVVGSGIAGCATALELLSAGWRVGILPRDDDVSAIESLSPAAVCDLKRLSIRIESNLSEVVAWWGSEREARMTTPGAAVAQRRLLANSLRLRAIESGATVIKGGKLGSIERFRDGWWLAYERTGGDRCRLHVKYLVDGTGRAAVVGRRLGAHRLMCDQLFCISISLHKPGLMGTWTESTSNGWWNLCCVQDEGTLSFYSNAQTIRETKRDIADRFYETRHLRHLLPTPILGNRRVRPCGSSRLAPSAGPGWISVGDAASTLQPLASAGVSKALRDARMARSALEEEEVDYDRFQLTDLTGYVRQLEQQYALEKRWSESPFWAAPLPNS